MAQCAVCNGNATFWRAVDGFDYFECTDCESIAIDPVSLAMVDDGTFPRNYDPSYWASEATAAHTRSWGSSIALMAETVLCCRRPIERFVDIGSGPGYLLDALAAYLPSKQAHFFAVEKFPPDDHTSHPGYLIGDLADMEGHFDAGVCVEVAEHLTPSQFKGIVDALARKSRPGSLFMFNTASPAFVKQHDPDYMDPLRRGHIISWGMPALKAIFEPRGFKVLPVGQKDFAFAVEFMSTDPMLLQDRIWYALAENKALLTDQHMGEVMYILGRDSMRAFS
jgi:SAM-dependent methyltransferase